MIPGKISGTDTPASGAPAPGEPRQVIPAPHAYRKLSESDLALMDRINEHRAMAMALLLKCEDYIKERGLASGGAGGRWLDPGRSLSIAATELQTGYAWLARAIAAPGFF